MIENICNSNIQQVKFKSFKSCGTFEFYAFGIPSIIKVHSNLHMIDSSFVMRWSNSEGSGRHVSEFKFLGMYTERSLSKDFPSFFKHEFLGASRSYFFPLLLPLTL